MSTEMPPPRRDSEAIQILATEHWSLLATRALTYQESLGRVNMFLTILSGAVIALALVAQADHFGPTFVVVAIFMLTVVFFTGVATIRRLLMLNRDDYKWVVGMNRLRHAYLDIHPELEPNFITSPHDDLQGALLTLGLDPVSAPTLGTVFHGFVTLPGMLGVIVAAVGGAIAGLAAAGFGAEAYVVLLVGGAAFVASLAGMLWSGSRSFRRYGPAVEPRFPTPKPPTSS
jgi:small basic protein